MKVKVAQLCPTHCDPLDYIVHGILHARILEWIAFPFSRGSSFQADSLPAGPQGKPKNTRVGSLFLFQQIYPTQESNWGLLHCRQILLQLNYDMDLKSNPFEGMVEEISPLWAWGPKGMGIGIIFFLWEMPSALKLTKLAIGMDCVNDCMGSPTWDKPL